VTATTGPRKLTLYRSARAESPHLGRLSFWTMSEENARSFAAWEARTIPQLGASRIYRAEVSVDDSAVYDATWPLGLVRPDHVLATADKLTEAGYEWVLIREGPIHGEWWTVAVYLGEAPVPAAPLELEP
jgi:hypothetical protein